MRPSRIWPAFSTARHWRCNPRHTREIRGQVAPGAGAAGRRQNQAVGRGNLSGKSSDLEQPEHGTGGSIKRDPVRRADPRRNGRTASIHTQPANRFGVRGPGPVQAIATFSPSAQNNWGATRSGRPPEEFLRFHRFPDSTPPRPRSSSAGESVRLRRVSR
jgi:hypothetical protein